MARIAFCQDVLIEYMGFMSMAAVLKGAGHTVEVFIDEQANGKGIMRELRAFKPDVVGFSLLSPSVSWALDLARRIKADIGSITVVGNVHVMMVPDIIHEDGIDIACLGEGEDALVELCDAIDQGKDYSNIGGFWVKTPSGVVKNPKRATIDVDAAPFIDRDIYNKYFFFRHSPYLRVMMGRGCPFRCSFCSNTVMTDHYGGMKAYVRKRTPAKAIAEIEHLISRHPRRVDHVFIIDEVLWVKNDWLREFLQLWKERIALPFTANFRFGGITEADIQLLGEAKAGPLAIATETGSEEQRQGILNKPVTNDHILQVGAWLHKYGISFGSTQFFGLPGDTVDDYLRYLPFFRQLNPRYLWTTFFQAYPGLVLSQHEAIRSHLPEDREFTKTLHHKMYLNLPNKERLVNLKKVYYLMMRYPRLEKPLLWLTKFRVPLLFDLLFMLHFTPYAFWWERISFFQFLWHAKIMALNPAMRRKQPLQSSGRPYVPPREPETTSAGTALSQA